MAIDLRIRGVRPELSTHEGISVRCELSNTGNEAVELPDPSDRSGAFSLHLKENQGAPVRTMNRQTRQAMMSDGRIDAALGLDSLGAGQKWEWPIDLASFHYPVPPGDYELNGQLSYPPAGLALVTDPMPLRVRGDLLCFVQAIHDNPIVDTMSLLLEAESPSGKAYFLRQHNYGRPLGAWYSQRVLKGNPMARPFLATAGFFQAETIDPAYTKWLIGTSGNKVKGHCYSKGVLTEQREGRLPERGEVIRSAFFSETGEVFVFLWSATGSLECHRLGQYQLEKLFEYRLPVAPGTAISIGAGDGSIHMAIPWRGILYDELDFSGRRLNRIHAFRTRLRPRSLEYDPALHRIKGLFVEPGHGKTVQMAVVNFKSDAVNTYAMDRVPLRGELRELHFDQDQRGRFHLLVSTSERNLYYLSEERGPILVCGGEDLYHPVVCAPLKVYFGFNRRDYGYRFVQYQRRSQGEKFAGMEAHPILR